MREVNRRKISRTRSKQLKLVKSKFSFFNNQKISQFMLAKQNRSKKGLYLTQPNDLQHRYFHV